MRAGGGNRGTPTPNPVDNRTPAAIRRYKRAASFPAPRGTPPGRMDSARIVGGHIFGETRRVVISHPRQVLPKQRMVRPNGYHAFVLGNKPQARIVELQRLQEGWLHEKPPGPKANRRAAADVVRREAKLPRDAQQRITDGQQSDRQEGPAQPPRPLSAVARRKSVGSEHGRGEEKRRRILLEGQVLPCTDGGDHNAHDKSQARPRGWARAPKAVRPAGNSRDQEQPNQHVRGKDPPCEFRWRHGGAPGLLCQVVFRHQQMRIAEIGRQWDPGQAKKQDDSQHRREAGGGGRRRHRAPAAPALTPTLSRRASEQRWRPRIPTARNPTAGCISA